ncbi:MAG: class I SAM-dependent methyltransferase [Planctomycetota bacterium]
MPLDMKGDWNKRARDDARFYIATSIEGTEAAFDASGKSDVGHFFDGLGELLHGDQVVLDIGCGIGRMDRHIAPRVARLVGIDVSGEMVARARARLGDLGNVEFVEGDGTSLRPLGDATFGLVFSHIVFQHIPRFVTRGYFREVHRVLRTGGEFVFQLPEAVPGAPQDPPDDDTFEMRFWREEDVRAELEACGFTWLECRRFAIDTPDLAGLNYLRLRVRK